MYEILREKPKGRTVFEYYWEGGYPCKKEGYLLYFDGCVYTVSADICNGIEERYLLVATCKPLADEVKKFIKDNKARVDALPKEIPFLDMVCDGSEDCYKFLNKRVCGCMVREQDPGNDVVALHDEIIAIFHKYNVVLEEEEEDG